MILILISGGILLFYVIFMTMITYGWLKLKTKTSPGGDCRTKVSVIVAARNEAGNIEHLLRALQNQDYPPELMEIIIVDDHSTDKTVDIIKAASARERFPIRLVELPRDLFGKKAAIHSGISISSGELILTTDADCSMSHAWVGSIAGMYESLKPRMILAPVWFGEGTTGFGLFQELEFMSLMAVTGGSAGIHRPLLANGANLAYEKEAYLQCGGFSENADIPSGDDVFLMLSITEKYGKEAVTFLKSENALVVTSPQPDLKSFLEQRLRWVSKSRGYTNCRIILSSVTVFLCNATFLLLLIAALILPGVFLIPAAGFYLIKLLTELPVMILAASFFGRRNLLFIFPLLEVLNSIYTVFIGLAGNFLSSSWKGRKISPLK